MLRTVEKSIIFAKTIKQYEIINKKMQDKFFQILSINSFLESFFVSKC